MDAQEAKMLVEECWPRFQAAGLPEIDLKTITSVKADRIASLWAGMGYIYDITVVSAAAPAFSIIAKRVQLPPNCTSIGDQRKKDSYHVEAAFYSRGYAEQLIAAGCVVPFPLYAETTSERGVTICMTKLVKGRGGGRGSEGTDSFVKWLAGLHACFWGARADAACGEGGLQAQGCYWHLDTRPDEHRSMGDSGWMGRLKLAARAIDMRLKADPMQTVCHGDAKGANIMYTAGEDGSCVPLVYDFQYCGKAAATKDLAYFFNVDAFPSASEEDRLLRFYLTELSRLLEAQGDVPPSFEVLKTSFELALADWRRFTEIGLGGWGDGGANKRVERLLDRLDGGKRLASEDAYIQAMQREYPV